jgi:predicted kinase
MKTIKLIVLQGAPASGKSTWVQEYYTRDKYETTIIVNRDSIRRGMGAYWVTKRESLVTQTERSQVHAAIGAGWDVIVDATNLNPKTIAYWEEATKAWNEDFKLHDIESQVVIEFREFKVAFEIALERDAQREFPVGKKVLRTFYSKYYPGFMDKVDKRNYVEYDPSLPDCIICDIDGTLSLMNGRNPFKGEDCDSDLVNTPVAGLLKPYSDYNNSCSREGQPLPDEYKTKIMLFSGRNGESEPQTRQWLKDNNIEFDELHMREPKNFEKDDILKERLYETHIKGKYNVKFVLDDRDQVVKKWRELGLPCFQVYYGDF